MHVSDNLERRYAPLQHDLSKGRMPELGNSRFYFETGRARCSCLGVRSQRGRLSSCSFSPVCALCDSMAWLQYLELMGMPLRVKQLL